jgi:SnoaL-like domain
MLPLFSEDAVLEIENMARYEGKAAISEMFLGSPALIRKTLHYMIAPTVEVARAGRTAQTEPVTRLAPPPAISRRFHSPPPRSSRL